MSVRPGDCPHCHAPAPVAGELTHRWDCPRSDEPKYFPDWTARHGYRTQPIPPVKFVPLPPLSTLSEDQLVDLIALALEVEAGWDELRRAENKARSAHA